MSNLKTYFVTLKPRQLFFFGGEQGETADYFLKGSYMPQQTALLGLVRHQILIQNNLLENNRIKDDLEATKWIGAQSFEYNKPDLLFGKINKISACYLVKNSEGVETKFLPFHRTYCSQIKGLGSNFYLPHYYPKKDYPEVWKSVDKDMQVSNEEIFSEVIKPGVDKNYKGKTDDGDKAYYKQVWLKMGKAFSFGFYVTLEDDVVFNTNEVGFGKENSAFLMEVSAPIEKIETFSDVDAPTALLLTSDTYIEEDIITKADFAVTDTVPFRNIVSPTSVSTDYYKIDTTQNPSNNRKSAVRLLLLKRGSIFYCKNGNLDAIKTAINKQKHFQKIGYNQYHLLNINY